MGMLVRTISQLDNVTASKLPMSSLIEISEDQGSGQYLSKNCRYEQLTGYLNDDISASMTRQYNLSATADDINISNVTSAVNSLYKSDVTITGTKTFESAIETREAYHADSDTQLPTVKDVKGIIDNSGIYIAESTFSPKPFDDSNEFAREAEAGENGYVRLKFEHPNNLKQTDEAIVDTTGQLVMWGWLADNGNVPAELAWVRLEALVKVDSDEKWVPIQVQPWIQGTKSKILQYVGFNVNVHKGLKLKVRTGFDVNLENGAFSTVGSMTYRSAGDTKCGFFGYIIKNA